MSPTSIRPPQDHPPAAAAGRRALVIRIGALGDVLLTRRLTHSLSLAGLRSTIFAPERHAALLRADPWIDGVFDSESPRFTDAFGGTWPEEHAGFDVAVMISQSVELCRAAESAAMTVIQIPPGPSRDDAPIAQQWADAASAACRPFIGRLPLLTTDLGRALVSGATLIHPGSGSLQKNWPIEGFVRVSRTLQQEGHRLLWIRGPAESHFHSLASGFEVIERPPLEVLSATLARARLFIGNDSGISHLAAAVGAPTIAIFGPTSDRVWRPDGPRVQTIRSASGELDAVSVAVVIAAINGFARLPRSDA